MNGLTDTADIQFLRRLRRLGPSRIQQLCEALEVTATAVRQRISRLQSAGYIDRRTIRAERGRPYHEYHITSAGVRQLGDDYAELAQILWKQVRQIEDPQTRNRLLGRIRQSLVDRYRIEPPTGDHEQPSTLFDRFEELRDVLVREGFEIEVHAMHVHAEHVHAGDEESLPVLREHFCPYHDLAAEDRTMCELERSVFGEVLGVPLSLSRRCHDGDNYCEFQPDLARGD